MADWARTFTGLGFIVAASFFGPQRRRFEVLQFSALRRRELGQEVQPRDALDFADGGEGAKQKLKR
jgi:hypothetical protein